MGAAGRQRVQALYDWRVVMQQHLELWKSLDDMRQKAIVEKHPALHQAPTSDPARQDPYRVFGGFPTQLIRGDTILRVVSPHGDGSVWQDLLKDKLFSYATDALPDRVQVDTLLIELGNHPQGVSLANLSQALGWSLARTIKTAAPLAKVCIVQLLAEKIDS